MFVPVLRAEKTEQTKLDVHQSTRDINMRDVTVDMYACVYDFSIIHSLIHLGPQNRPT